MATGFRPRFSVARCCCDGTGPQPETIIVGIDEVNVYDAENLTVVGTGAGLGASDLGPPWNFYITHQQWRFVNVGIPNNATIVNARLVAGSLITFQVGSIGTDNPPNDGTAFARIRWYGEDVDDAAPYTTPADYITRPRTTASIDTADFYSLDPADNPSEFDVTSLVQEIVDRPGWATGNDMAFITEDNGSDSLGEGTAINWAVHLAGSGPDLEITYTP